MTAKLVDPLPEWLTKFPASPRQYLFPDVVLWILLAPDAVEVMSLTPQYFDEEDDDDEGDIMPNRVKQVGPRYLHGHYIRGAARVPTEDRRRELSRALAVANWVGYGMAMCFDPHYAVRVSRGGQTADLLICFGCGNVQVVLPGERGVLYPIARSVEHLIRRELRRGGVGWLWFWRRWLPWR